MTDDSDYIRLTPPDDRYPAPEGLLRKPEELTDEQFDLLAVAWAEETLAGDSLAEFNSVITAIPSRKMRAESFSKVRLTPFNDKWIYRNSLIRQSPATKAIRRTLVISLLSAAAVIAFLITGPAIRSRTTETLPGTLPEGTVMSEALIPEAYPVIIPDGTQDEASGARSITETEKPATRLIAHLTDPVRTGTAGAIAERGIAVSDAGIHGPVRAVPGADMTVTDNAVAGSDLAYQARTLPVTLAITAASPVMITAAKTTDLHAVQMAAIIPAQNKADNWIVRGISLLAKTVTKEEKNIDGYVIASACVNGINNVLGWEMQLEQANNQAGDPVAVNFSSSLLSFSKPVNKNSP